MKKLALRFFVVSLAILILATLYYFQDIRVAQGVNPAYDNGWFLFVLLNLLLAFNIRKKLIFLPLGKVKTWADIHYFLGFLFIGGILIHFNFSLSGGLFNSLFLLLVVLTLVTGGLGLYWSRSIPKRLSNRGEYVVLERIPYERQEIVNTMERIVETSLEQDKTIEIASFYRDRIKPFLLDVSDKNDHLVSSDKPMASWKKQFNDLKIQLSSHNAGILDQLWPYVERKVHLDYHHVKLTLLRKWLFIHIPLAYLSLVFMLLHVLIVFSFVGEV